jgi:hypothetical protein
MLNEQRAITPWPHSDERVMTNQHLCPDCGVAVGQKHINECDVERCSVCGGQRNGCNCVGHGPVQAVWAGEWPEMVRQSQI